MIKAFAVLGGLSVFISVHGQNVVPRAGQTGPPMLMGTSVMGPSENLLVKALGFSHLQTDSDHLTVNEPEPGHWDWSAADAGFAAAQQAGLKWQYFPHYHWPPAWYRKSAKFVPSMGLRSGRKLAAMSIWSPDVVPWFEHCYGALAQHYNRGQIYAIYVGIHGDFGETIFPMGWHPDEAKRFGANGTGEADFWCGDAYAREDFRERMRHKYHTLAGLNAAWGTHFADVSQIDFPPAACNGGADFMSTAERRRHWLDFIQWYDDSMTRYTGEVCKIARHYFPKALLQIPIGGGSENVVYGQDSSALPKVAGRYGVHVRSTHGGYMPFAKGYAAMVKRIATASKLYGVPHWLEPPSNITPEGEVARIMEALSCGNYGFWDWGANPVSASNVFRTYANFFTREKPVVDVALFFPTSDSRLHPEIDFPRQLQGEGMLLRDALDFDMMDEELINDKGLKNYRALVWVQGRFIEEKTLKKIAAWVKRGGVLVFRKATPPVTVEGKTEPGQSLIEAATQSVDVKGGRATRHGKGWVIVCDGDDTTFNQLVRNVTYNLSKLDPAKKDALNVDSDWDGVYATLLSNGEAILYNATTATIHKTMGGAAIDLPPKSLRSVMARVEHHGGTD